MSATTLTAIFVSSLFAAPAAKTSKAPTEAVIDVSHSGSSLKSFSFTVPVDGSVGSPVQQTDRPAESCRAAAVTEPLGIAVTLRCRSMATSTLDVMAKRPANSRKRTKVAEVKHPDGSTARVFVTLR